jgi:hypothetical protein
MGHVATKATIGVSHPTDVLQCEDGSIMVVGQAHSAGVVHVGEDGVTARNIMILGVPDNDLEFSLSRSQTLNAVCVQTYGGNVFLLRDAWIHSSRAAWVSATTIRYM